MSGHCFLVFIGVEPLINRVDGFGENVSSRLGVKIGAFGGVSDGRGTDCIDREKISTLSWASTSDDEFFTVEEATWYVVSNLGTKEAQIAATLVQYLDEEIFEEVSGGTELQSTSIDTPEHVVGDFKDAPVLSAGTEVWSTSVDTTEHMVGDFVDAIVSSAGTEVWSTSVDTPEHMVGNFVDAFVISAGTKELSTSDDFTEYASEDFVESDIKCAETFSADLKALAIVGVVVGSKDTSEAVVWNIGEEPEVEAGAEERAVEGDTSGRVTLPWTSTEGKNLMSELGAEVLTWSWKGSTFSKSFRDGERIVLSSDAREVRRDFTSLSAEGVEITSGGGVGLGDKTWTNAVERASAKYGEKVASDSSTNRRTWLKACPRACANDESGTSSNASFITCTKVEAIAAICAMMVEYSAVLSKQIIKCNGK